MRVTSPPESPTPWFSFLDERLRAAVRAAAAGDENPDDALRGLYISDEQALSLAGGSTSADADPWLATAAARLGLDALESAVHGGLRGARARSAARTPLRLPAGRRHPPAGQPATGGEPARRRRCGPRGRARLLWSGGAPRARRGDPPAGGRPGSPAGGPSGEARRPAGGLPARGGRGAGRGRCARAPAARRRRPGRARRGASTSSSMWPGCWRRVRGRRSWSAGRTRRRWWRRPPMLRWCSSTRMTSRRPTRWPMRRWPRRWSRPCCASTGSTTSTRPSVPACSACSTSAATRPSCSRSRGPERSPSATARCCSSRSRCPPSPSASRPGSASPASVTPATSPRSSDSRSSRSMRPPR